MISHPVLHVQEMSSLERYKDDGCPIILKYVRVGPELRDFRFIEDHGQHVDLVNLREEKVLSAGMVHIYLLNPPSERIWVGNKSHSLSTVTGQGFEPLPDDEEKIRSIFQDILQS